MNEAVALFVRQLINEYCIDRACYLFILIQSLNVEYSIRNVGMRVNMELYPLINSHVIYVIFDKHAILHLAHVKQC